MPVRDGPTHRRPLGPTAFALALLLLGPKLAFAQTGERLWGYVFAAPAFFSDSVAIPITFEPFSLTPRTFDVYRYRDTVLHLGPRPRMESVGGLGLAGELSALHLARGRGRPDGLLSANASYHFGQPSRRLVPFATGGYSFGINSNHGFDVGGGMNYWLTPGTGLRLEVRGTALKAVNILTVPGRFEPYAWTIDARAGLNFGRR
jgi:hypothetical protein